MGAAETAVVVSDAMAGIPYLTARALSASLGAKQYDWVMDLPHRQCMGGASILSGRCGRSGAGLCAKGSWDEYIPALRVVVAGLVSNWVVCKQA